MGRRQLRISSLSTYPVARVSISSFNESVPIVPHCCYLSILSHHFETDHYHAFSQQVWCQFGRLVCESFSSVELKHCQVPSKPGSGTCRAHQGAQEGTVPWAVCGREAHFSSNVKDCIERTWWEWYLQFLKIINPNLTWTSSRDCKKIQSQHWCKQCA